MVHAEQKAIAKKPKKEKDPNAPKRPKSAYMEYVRDHGGTSGIAVAGRVSHSPRALAGRLTRCVMARDRLSPDARKSSKTHRTLPSARSASRWAKSGAA
eukprot:COSAG02_NODE_4145_length_5717_cov_40.762193_1_plen_99_part_00